MKTFALVTAALAALQGCSAVWVHTWPDDPEPRVWPRCTEAPLFPAIDTAIAVISAAGAAYLAANPDHDQYAELGAGVLAIDTAAFALSAIAGWRRIGHCRDERDAYEAAARAGR